MCWILHSASEVSVQNHTKSQPFIGLHPTASISTAVELKLTKSSPIYDIQTHQIFPHLRHLYRRSESIDMVMLDNLVKGSFIIFRTGDNEIGLDFSEILKIITSYNYFYL